MITGNNSFALHNQSGDETNVKTIESQCDDLFMANYIVYPPPMHPPPISDKLALTIMQWCRLPAKKEEIKELFKQSLVPKNI